MYSMAMALFFFPCCIWPISSVFGLLHCMQMTQSDQSAPSSEWVGRLSSWSRVAWPLQFLMHPSDHFDSFWHDYSSTIASTAIDTSVPTRPDDDLVGLDFSALTIWSPTIFKAYFVDVSSIIFGSRRLTTISNSSHSSTILWHSPSRLSFLSFLDIASDVWASHGSRLRSFLWASCHTGRVSGQVVIFTYFFMNGFRFDDVTSCSG